MPADHSNYLSSIDIPQVTEAARRAVGRANLQIKDWRVSQLGGGMGNPVSVGLYRYEGTGQASGEEIPWSVILKIVQSPANVGWENMGEGDDPTHWNYWKRELLIYPSGFLDTLPEGLAAPRYYGGEELPGNVGILWLEDIRDDYPGAWSLSRYALAARHLGRLNGKYVSGVPIPPYPWFGRFTNRQWVTTMPHLHTIQWDHPRVLQLFPRPEENSYRRLLQEHERIIEKLSRLPQTICHGDTYPTNLMSRREPDGREITIALDWALAGIQPLGDDLGQLLYGALMNLKDSPKDEITEVVFQGYLDGLSDEGCKMDPKLVRFGFTASAAFRVGMLKIVLLGEEIQHNPHSAEHAAEPTEIPYNFEVAMANEAFALLETI